MKALMDQFILLLLEIKVVLPNDYGIFWLGEGRKRESAKNKRSLSIRNSFMNVF